MTASPEHLEQNIENGCPRNRELIFDLEHHISSYLLLARDELYQKIKKSCGAEYRGHKCELKTRVDIYCNFPIFQNFAC